ncbi:MAG: alpha/beta fold hydrolase [Alistipes sp.]|nr:alpha/beta fold hydrolase [Alistipes sp.]
MIIRHISKAILGIMALLCCIHATHAASRELTISRPWGTISATLDTPTEGSNTAVIIIAGSGPTDRYGNSGLGLNTYCYKMLAEELVAQGVAVLRYDKRGIGLSHTAAEDVPNLILDDYVDDARACVDHLRTEGFERVILVGHSEGGLIALIVATQGEGVTDGVVALCAPGYAMDTILMRQLSAQLIPSHMGLMACSTSIIQRLKRGESVAEEEIPQELISLFHPIVQPFLINNMQYDPAEVITRCTAPVLIITGGRDIQVSVDNGTRLNESYPAAQHITFENMTHVLKDASTSDRIEQMMSIYTNSTLPLTEQLAPTIASFINNI